MYILSDCRGNFIQKSNADINDLNQLIIRFTNEFNTQIIGTIDDTLYLKTMETGYFDIIIKDDEIVDIIPKEKLIDLDEYKQNKTNQSKQQLAEFLQTHPLLYNGEFYSVTQEKQALLTSVISAYQLKIQAGIPATLKWNVTGDICREFTVEEITGLVVAIAGYVQPLVEKQQTLEVQIKNAETLEELEGIEINYETA